MLIIKRITKCMTKGFNLDSLDRTEDISIDEIRSLDTFKEWDEERISELIRTVKALTKVMYNNWSRANKIGKEIALGNDNHLEIKTAA